MIKPGNQSGDTERPHTTTLGVLLLNLGNITSQILNRNGILLQTRFLGEGKRGGEVRAGKERVSPRKGERANKDFHSTEN